jgi:CHAT domain-containing protein
MSCGNKTVTDCFSKSASRTELGLHTSTQRVLRGGETQCYEVAVGKDQYVHLTITQQGIDVVVTVFDSAAQQLVRIDRPNGSRGREAITLIAAQDSKRVLQIRSLEPAVNQSRYTLVVDAAGPASTAERDRALAEQTVSDAEDLRASNKAATVPLAIKQFRGSLKQWRELSDPYEECVALYGLALALRAANENEEAISRFEESSAIARDLGDRYMEAVALKDEGWSLIYLGDTREAFAKFSNARQFLKAINDQQGEAIALYGIGWVDALQGSDEQALEQFKQSLDIRRAISDSRGEALTLIGMGKILNRMNRNEEAIKALDESLCLLGNKKGDARADALSALGWVNRAQRQLESAGNRFNEALEIWKSSGNETGEATTLYGLARVELQLGDPLKAQAHMERALNIVESMRSKGANERLRTSYFALVQDYFEFDIDLLMQLERLYPKSGYASRAFEVSERSRNRRLLDLLNEANGDIRAGIDPSLAEMEKTLSSQLGDAARSLKANFTTNAATETSATSRKIDDLTARLEEVQARIRRVSPQYALLAEARTINVGQVQKELLDDDDMLLEYALGNEKSYLWAITRRDMKSYELPPGRQLIVIAEALYQLLASRDIDINGETATEKAERIKQCDSAYADAAANVSRILLGPVASQLGHKRLIVVAQSALGMLPFSALPVPHVTDKTQNVPLVLHHEIINAPSASSLNEFRKRDSQRPRASRTIAIIGDPVFGRDDDRFETMQSSQEATANKVSAQSLPRLFGSHWEATEIGELVAESERSIALGFAANRNSSILSNLAEYRFVHFATHTLIDHANPELSRIALSAFDSNGNAIDGFLYAHEIYRLHLHAEVVVLSSCRTALGNEVKGEGLTALSHAFMCAGVPRVVGTLWNVSDTGTSEFMVRYYRKLLGGHKLRPAAALRATQIEFSKDKRWETPYFWAAFVYQGEWRGW